MALTEGMREQIAKDSGVRDPFAKGDKAAAKIIATMAELGLTGGVIGAVTVVVGAVISVSVGAGAVTVNSITVSVISIIAATLEEFATSWIFKICRFWLSSC